MQYLEIPVTQLKQEASRWTILDVRTDEEFAAGHIDTALHIPLHELSFRMDELDPSLPLAVVCRSGCRSKQATHMLLQSEFEAVNVQGGMKAWASEIDSTITVA